MSDESPHQPENPRSNLPDVSIETLSFSENESRPPPLDEVPKSKMAIYGHGEPIAQFTNESTRLIFEQFGHVITFLLYTKYQILFVEYGSFEEAQQALEKANAYFEEQNIRLIFQLSSNFRPQDFDPQDLSKTLFCWHPGIIGLSITDSTLAQYFMKYGPISRIRGVKKKNYFFVEFEKPEDAVNALQNVEEDLRKHGLAFQIRLSTRKEKKTSYGMPRETNRETFDSSSRNTDLGQKKVPYRHENIAESILQNQRAKDFRSQNHDRYDRRPREMPPPYEMYHGYPLEPEYMYSTYPMQYQAVSYYPVYQYEINPQAWAYPRTYDEIAYY